MRTSENRTTEIRRSQGPGVQWLLLCPWASQTLALRLLFIFSTAYGLIKGSTFIKICKMLIK